MTAQKSQLTLPQELFKTGEDADDVDDEVRTTVSSKNRATETPSTEESFLQTQYL